MFYWAGHHADINLRVARELQNRGHQVKTFADERFPKNDSQIQIEPLTKRYPYDIATQIGQIDSINSQINALLTESKLFVEILKKVDAADITIFPTLFDYQLLSLSSGGQHLGKIVGCLHADPNKFNAHGSTLWRIALDSICTLGNIKLGCFEPLLKARFESLFPSTGILLEEFPIPHDGGSVARSEGALITVGILGNQRPDKGIRSIPSLALTINRLGLKVIIQDSSPHSNIKVTGRNPNIEIVGYVENIGEVVKRCSVVLLNYDVNVYQTIGSGIAWEALASGVPILAPQGTTMANLISQFSCGEVFNSTESKSIDSMLSLMQKNYQHYLDDSQKAQDKYHRIHGTTRFADYILSDKLFTKA